MHRYRRATALLVNLLLVQLLLVGTGTSCASRFAAAGAHATGAHATGAHVTGARVATSAGRAASGHAAGSERGRQPSTDCATAGDAAPCRMPAMPGGGCPQASACTAPMLVVQPVALAGAPDASRAAVSSERAPLALTSSPDVPPPRA